MLRTTFPINTSIRSHLKLALVVAVWLVVFLVLIAPFDTADLPWKIRLLLLPPYGLLFIVAYLPAIGYQNWLYRRTGQWHLLAEASVVLLSYVITLFLCFAYYKTDIIRGTFSFWEFVGTVYLPIVFVISFLLLLGRWFISRKAPAVAKPLLALRGANRQDVLRVHPDHLIGIQGAQNYAEVHYLEAGVPTKKLLRVTLTKLSEQVPGLLRVHRSYLINPIHFIRWGDGTTAILPGMEVPVSKKYRAALEAVLEKA